MSSLSVTPYISGVVKYNWSGYDEVSVELPEELRENTTYVVTLGKELRTRRGAPLTDPMQIVFSTGAVIDTGHISGTMLTPLSPGAPTDLSNVSIFAYDISAKSVDTLHVNLVRPDYITQPNAKGIFEFRAMKVGHSYRIFALIDEFRNKVFDTGIDAYGVSNKDVILSAPEGSDIHIRMAPKSDSVKPILQDFDPVDQYHLRAKFSKAVDSQTVRREVFSLKDSLGIPIPILSAFRENVDRKPGTIMLLLASPMKEGKKYSLDVDKKSAHDLARNQVSDSSLSITLMMPSLRDTFPPPKFIGYEFADSSKGIAQDQEFRISFTDAVDTSSVNAGLTLVDSASKLVALKYRWIDGSKLRVHSLEKLPPQTFFALSLKGKSIISPLPEYESKFKDTTFRLRFFTGDDREFGTISGEVQILDLGLASDPNKVVMLQLLSSDANQSRSVTLPTGKRSYIFEHLPRGKYRIRGWVSTVGAKGYDDGSIIPYRFAAPSGDYPDEIDVRPRWTVEKINFDIK